MRYWPLSTLAASPVMPSWFLPELLYGPDHMITPAAAHACGHIAMSTPAVVAPKLCMVENEGSYFRRLYTDYPNIEEWLRLERRCVVQFKDGQLMLFCDGLH